MIDHDRVGEPDRLSASQTDAWRARQKQRALWTALMLVALVVLVFFIAVRKMQAA